MDGNYKFGFATINGDLAHTCGNITSVIFEDFKSHFPKSFFKSEHVSTRLAIRQFKSIKKIVELKKQKPMVAIQPKLEVERNEEMVDAIRHLFDTNIMDVMDEDFHNVKFFKDTEHGIFVDFGIDRLKMSFEFNVVVSTEFQQYNVSLHMRNKFRIGHPYYLPTLLEYHIPDSIIKKISKDSGIPIKSEQDGTVIEFIRYLNKISNIPITYQYQNATGYYKFFMYIKTNMLIQYNDISISDGEKVGQVSDHFPITMEANISLNYPNCFYYLIKNGEKLELDSGSDEDSLNILDSENVNLYYTFQRTIIMPRDQDNKELYMTMGFTVEDGKKQDIIDISSIFNKEQKDLLTILDAGIKNVSKSLSDFINIVIYKDGIMLRKDLDYYVNMVTKELLINNPDSSKTYRMVVYMNNSILNEYQIRTNKKYK